MQDRRDKEMALLRQQYPSVERDEGFSWVQVHGVELADEWNRDTTPVLLEVSSAYPETPPRNFWVPAGLECRGQQPQNFNRNHKKHNGKQWDMFSWRVENNWTPAPRIEDGSNLLTFMNSVESRLSEGV